MRALITSLSGLALVFATAGCGPRALALPDDPIQKAATCGVVAAAHARKAGNQARGALPFADQGRILHYAMLTAAGDDGFETDKAAAVTAAMPELEPKITGGKFEELVQPCAAAYPETTRVKDIALPDGFDAALGCNELGGFLAHALREASVDYGPQLSDYGELRRRLDNIVAVGLKQEGASAEAAQKKVKSKALAKFTRLGSPMAVMDACIARYPVKKA